MELDARRALRDYERSRLWWEPVNAPLGYQIERETVETLFLAGWEAARRLFDGNLDGRKGSLPIDG